jgi:MOSC domain-containing protein YiiM
MVTRKQTYPCMGAQREPVYAYPVEHYQHWRREFPDMELPPGVFGENLRLKDCSKLTSTSVIDFASAPPRCWLLRHDLSCYKLGIKFGRPDILKKLLATRYTGFYCAVLREGEVQAGDKIKRLERDQTAVSVDDIVQLYGLRKDAALLQKAIDTKSLPESWRDYFRLQLDKVNADHERNVI